MNNQEAIEILQTKYNIEGPVKIVCDELMARNIAVKALEKQIPKKVITKYACGKLPNDTAYCPSCNAYLSIHHKYCFNCGQALERGEVVEMQ